MKIKIDPRMFIKPPFNKCPKCGKDAYGVLGIGMGYTRRCKECWYTQGYELPKLKREIIYLDQFVFSNMMKAISPKVKVREGTDLSFYKVLFEKLDRLVKLQLILCPASSTHTSETLTSSTYDALKRITEHLSHNTRFYPNETIQRFQVIGDFREWLGVDSRKIDVNTVTYGRLDEWLDRLYISVDLSKGDTDLIERIRSEREQAEQALLPVFKRWQAEKDKKFDDWLKEEQDAVGRSYWQMAVRRLEDILPSEREVILIDMLELLSKQGLDRKAAISKANDYLTTQIKEVPHVKISSMLYAAMAREASLGRKNPYNRGTFNDVEFVSTLAPYCNAMFIDKEFQTRICNEPLKSRLGLSDKIYSLNTQNEFMAYLEEIENKMSKKHLKLVHEVYGDWYDHPYTTMFEEEG